MRFQKNDDGFIQLSFKSSGSKKILENSPFLVLAFLLLVRNSFFPLSISKVSRWEFQKVVLHFSVACFEATVTRFPFVIFLFRHRNGVVENFRRPNCISQFTVITIQSVTCSSFVILDFPFSS